MWVWLNNQKNSFSDRHVILKSIRGVIQYSGPPSCSMTTQSAQVKGEVIIEGVVAALSERQGVATVVDDAGVEMSCPIARLMPPRKEVLPIDSLDITSQLVDVLHRFIKLTLPPEPASGDASSPSHVACRLE